MAGKDQTTTIIVVVVIMMVTVIALGSGWYILSGDDDKKDKKKGSECTGPDVNAVYQYDDDENCVWVSGGGGGGGSNQANKEGDGGGASGSNQGNNGEPPPCEYNQENPYITGSCFNTDGVELIGGIDSCGDGQRSITVNGIGSCPEPYNEFCNVPCPCILDEDEPLLKGACERNGVELIGGIDSCGVGIQLLTPNGEGDCPEPFDEMCNVACPCVLDEDEPYTYGQCLNKETGEPLTEDKNNCGPGHKWKVPNKVVNASGGGSCPESELVDCDKPCARVCEVPDQYWTPVEGAFCMSGTKKLGVEIPLTEGEDGAMVTLHGEGMQRKEVDGTGLTESQKDDMNFDKCVVEGETLKSCKVDQTDVSQAVSCPVSNFDPGWSYQGGGTIYTKESVDKLFKGELERGVLDLEAMTPVSREAAIQSGAFNQLTGEVYEALMPRGDKIAFKASSEYSTDWLRKNGCSIFKTEDVVAPRTREDATWKEVAEETGDCYDVRCGLLQKRDIDHNIDLLAWGGGSTNKPAPSSRDCTTGTLPCCGKGNTYHYTEGVCDSTGKKTFSKTDECSLFNDSSGVANYQEDCCYVGDWDGGECNVGDKLGYKKYTRNVPNAGICTGQQLGEHEVGDPNVKYTRDADACDTDCVIGALTITDSDASGNQFMINSGTRRSYARKVSYAGSTPAEGLGSNWCSEWQNLVRECPSCPNTINIAENDILMTSSNGLLPVGNTHRTKIMDALGLSSGGTNYFSCGGSGRWNSNQTGYNSNANCGAGNAPPPYWE